MGMQDYLVDKRPTSQEDQSGSVKISTGEQLALNMKRYLKIIKIKWVHLTHLKQQK